MAKKNQTAQGSDDKRKAEQRAAEEEARRQAEEEARKERIRSEILEKQSQISSLDTIKSALESSKANIDSQILKWNSAKFLFQKDTMNAAVVVKEVFEGNAANIVKAKNEKYIDKMDGKISSAADVKDKLAGQITKLSCKVYSLKNEISSLRSQL